MKRSFGVLGVLLVFATGTLNASAAKSKAISKEPYIGAIAIDAETGQTILEDHPDAAAYPASVVKLMNMMVVLDKIKAGELRLSDMVTVTREAMEIGGTQVWLETGEVFSVEDLIYSLMLQSANDSATALAIHIAGSTEMYIKLMNDKANALGLRSTIFRTVHGLPPSSPGIPPDMTTPRDIATLSRALLMQHPEALTYTSTRRRDFRTGADRVDMVNHNRLLKEVPGCDGLKTGFYRNAGFSISATVLQNGRRAIVVVMGSPTRVGRDAAAKQLIAKAMSILPTMKPPPPPPPPPKPVVVIPPPPPEPVRSKWVYGIGVLAALAIVFAIGRIVLRRPNSRDF